MLRHQPLAQPPALLPALAAVERERGGDGRQPRLGVRRLVQPHHHRDGVGHRVGARADEREGGRGGRRQAGTDEAAPEAEARDAVLLAVGEREHQQVDRRAARLPEVVVVAQPVLGLPAVVPHREGAAVELVLAHVDAAVRAAAAPGVSDAAHCNESVCERPPRSAADSVVFPAPSSPQRWSLSVVAGTTSRSSVRS